MRKQIGICICLGMTVWLGGCGAAAHRNPAVGDPDKLQTRVSVREGTAKVYKKQGGYRQNNGVTKTKASDYDKANRSAADRAQRLSDAVVNLPEIEKASVVITGNTAIVGIELTGELNDEKLIRCKTEVEEKVRATDSAIDHVAVTAAGDLVKRIQIMSDPGAGQSTPPPVPDSLRPVVESLTPVS